MEFAHYPLPHVTHAPAKSEVATFNGLRGEIYKNTLFDFCPPAKFVGTMYNG